MSFAFPNRLAVYIIYKDPLVDELYPDYAKRETMGWLSKEIGGFVCIHNDRTLETPNTSHGSGHCTFVSVNWIEEVWSLEKGEKIDLKNLFKHKLS